MFDFAGKAKHKAWKELEGMSQEDAKSIYVVLLRDVSGVTYCIGSYACSRSDLLGVAGADPMARC